MTVASTVPCSTTPSLDLVTALAVGSVGGTATLRAAVGRPPAVSRPRPAPSASPTGEIADPDRFLREALADAARLEAHVVGHVGHRAEAMGRSRDDAIRFWTDAAVERRRHARRRPVSTSSLDPAAEAMARRSPTTRQRRHATPRRTPTPPPTASRTCGTASSTARVSSCPTCRQPPSSAVSCSRGSSSSELDAADRQTVRQADGGDDRRGVNIDGNALRDVVKTRSCRSTRSSVSARSEDAGRLQPVDLDAAEEPRQPRCAVAAASAASGRPVMPHRPAGVPAHLHQHRGPRARTRPASPRGP